jgi:hypothetical protein
MQNATYIDKYQRGEWDLNSHYQFSKLLSYLYDDHPNYFKKSVKGIEPLLTKSKSVALTTYTIRS